MLSAPDYQYLYQITAKFTPLAEDCGILCGKTCCSPGKNNELGMYLFPGEEVMYTRRENWLLWEEQDPTEQLFPASWPNPVYFVRCTGPCPREKRPLACRFFPLTPHLQLNGELLMIYETLDLPYKCPLITQSRPLQQNFISMVTEAWRIMLKDPQIYELVLEDSRYREENNFPVQIVLG